MENAKRIARELKERYDTEDPFQIAGISGHSCPDRTPGKYLRVLFKDSRKQIHIYQ